MSSSQHQSANLHDPSREESLFSVFHLQGPMTMLKPQDSGHAAEQGELRVSFGPGEEQCSALQWRTK